MGDDAAKRGRRGCQAAAVGVEISKHGKPVAHVVTAAEWAFLQDCEDLHWGPHAEASGQDRLRNPGAARSIDEVTADRAKDTAAE